MKEVKFLVEGVKELQKTVTDEKKSRECAEKELAQLRSLVAGSNALNVKLTESKMSMETVYAEVALLEDQVVRGAAESAKFDKIVTEVREESEQLLGRLNVAIDDRNWQEK